MVFIIAIEHNHSHQYNIYNEFVIYYMILINFTKELLNFSFIILVLFSIIKYI